MKSVRNVLFIMCDQLRADYLSCMGHPTLQTPNIDSLAKRGVMFDRAYCSAPTCGPSRMSFYTGRSMFSHGAMWNFIPLSLREFTIGDYLQPAGIRVALAGKTHFGADLDSIKRFGIDTSDRAGQLLLEGGFDVVDRYEGHANPGKDHPYVKYLREHGYGNSDDPWEDYVMSAVDERGERVSGWNMRNVHLPAQVREEHSETAYTTDLAIRFIQDQGERPWFLHLSYIKPHWPYLAPSPYHNLYREEDCIAPIRSQHELEDPHPVQAAFYRHRESEAFTRDEVLKKVKPAYMGLVKQIDDHIGRLLKAMEDAGRLKDTLIVFTSDHGDYLGDHWLGDKDLFHEPSARIPFLMVDPDPRSDKTRGTTNSNFVEAIDFLPTVLDALSLEPPRHLLEGESLLPLIRGETGISWRPAAVSEIDYSFREARVALGQHPRKCRGYMVRNDRWKYVFWEGFRPQLFDLENDPNEYRDLGGRTDLARVTRECSDFLFEWMRRRKLSVTLPDERIVVSRDTIEREHGIQIGVW